MLKNFKIESFHCFEKTSIENFEQINLIVGKNNAQKTSLLEAMFYFVKGKINSIEKNFTT